MDCPKCGGNVYCKDGIVQGRQRYLCKGCRYRYTVEQRSGTGGKAPGIGALPGGTGLQIDRSYFVVSNVSILNWVTKSRRLQARRLAKPCPRSNEMSRYR